MEIDNTKLMKLRVNKNLSQYQVSIDTGISRVTINKIESGKNKNPSFITMMGLCEYYKVSILSVIKSRY